MFITKETKLIILHSEEKPGGTLKFIISKSNTLLLVSTLHSQSDK